MIDNKSIETFYKAFYFVDLDENTAQKFCENPAFTGQLKNLSNNIVSSAYIAIESIKTNLWGLTTKEDRELYLKKIIRDTNQATVGIIKNAAITNDYQNGNLETENADTFSFYIINCWFCIHQFKQSLDVICADFSLDLFKIQNEISINFIEKRYLDALLFHGHNELFEVKEFELENGEKIKYTKLKDVEHTPIEKLQTKTEIIKTNLTKYGFFEIEKVKCLQNSDKLIELIAHQQTPYQIAMFEYLLFTIHIKKEHADNKIAKRNTILAEILGAKSVDSVKHNILTLNTLKQHSEKYKAKNTAWMHTETVKNDYKTIN